MGLDRDLSRSGTSVPLQRDFSSLSAHLTISCGFCGLEGRLEAGVDGFQ